MFENVLSSQTEMTRKVKGKFVQRLKIVQITFLLSAEYFLQQVKLNLHFWSIQRLKVRGEYLCYCGCFHEEMKRTNVQHLTEMLYTTFQNGAKENLCIA